MSILSGFFKTKKYRKTDTGYQLQSEWTSASTVEMADGNTAENNLGAIQGITDSLTATSSNIALSAKAGNNLQGQIDDVNSNLNPDYSRYTFTQYTSGSLPVITASERVDVLITVEIAYNGKQLRLFPNVNNVGLAHSIGGGRSMEDNNVFANVAYSETIRLGKGDVLKFNMIGSLSATNLVTIGLLPYK